MKKCYLCGAHNFTIKNNRTRDIKKLRVLECQNCSLVFLESFSHLENFSYIDSENNYEKKIKTVEEYQALLKDLKVDDEYRFKQWKKILKNKAVLDFGSGAGGFLKMILPITKIACGVELDSITRFYSNKIKVKKNIDDFDIKFDVITLFHVLEHIEKPIELLKKIKQYLKPGGKIIIEVPNDDDALISYYKSPAFKDFTYWSLHLYSYNRKTITQVCRRAGLKKVGISFRQRYTLANHLGWLKNGQPDGQKIFIEFNDRELNKCYVKQLKRLEACDTLVVVLKIK